MRHIAVVAVVFGLAACGSSSTTPSTAATATASTSSGSTSGSQSSAGSPGTVIVRRSPTASVTAGDQSQGLALVVLATGENSTVTNQATWSTADPSIATVNSSGLISFVATGTTDIRATYNGVVGSLQVSVLPVSQVKISGLESPQMVGSASQLYVTAVLSDGTDDASPRATFMTSDSSVGAVSADGVFSANGVGQANISATVNGVTSTARATVLAAGSLSCSYAVSPTSHTFETGNFVNITVTAPAGCPWTYHTDVSWLSLHDGKSIDGPFGNSGSSTGTGLVQISFDWDAMVACNCGTTATVLIAGQQVAINNGVAQPAPDSPLRR